MIDNTQVMEEDEIRRVLEEMNKDKALLTDSTYAANAVLWPDHKMTFVDKHLAYMKAHPNVNPRHYLSNLRLMIKKRSY